MQMALRMQRTSNLVPHRTVTRTTFPMSANLKGPTATTTDCLMFVKLIAIKMAFLMSAILLTIATKMVYLTIAN